MIAATGIQDQELAIAAKRSGVNNPTVAGRGYLGARMSGDRLSLLGSTRGVRAAEVADFHSVNRQPQAPAHGGKSDCRCKPARILERRQRWAGRILFDRAGLGMRVARRWIER